MLTRSLNRLFWFAWTSFPSVPWIVPIIASSLFGAGIYVVILGVLNYVVDSYQTYSASALAGVILIRNLVGAGWCCPMFKASKTNFRVLIYWVAGFPLFASQMYERLGNEWASTLLAFLSLLFVPIPIWWFYRGEQLRLRSPWARYVLHSDKFMVRRICADSYQGTLLSGRRCSALNLCYFHYRVLQMKATSYMTP